MLFYVFIYPSVVDYHASVDLDKPFLCDDINIKAASKRQLLVWMNSS